MDVKSFKSLKTICRHKISNVLKLINDCDKKLLSFGAEIHFNAHLKIILLYMTILGAFILFIESYFAFDVIYVKLNKLDIHIFAMYLISHIVHGILLSQYLFLEFAVKKRFEALNKNFR